MFNINLEEVDTDGAIREAHEAVSGDSRLGFLKKAGLGAGAMLSGGAILGALAPSAMAAGGAAPGGDVGILNFALTLEYLERAFYNEATKKLKGLSSAESTYLKTVTKDEQAHVAFLSKALGSKAVPQPKFAFGDTTSDPKTFLATSYALENTGVHAYLGQAGFIKDPAYLLAAASIVTIEARHSGAVALLVGKKIDSSGSFDKPLSYDAIIKIVKGTGFLK